MIKLEYNFKTKGPLHTGSDINAGTMKTLRRQKCVLHDPALYRTRLDEEAHWPSSLFCNTANL